MQRLAIIGLDGANLDIIERGVAEGRLPHFKHILENGAAGELETTHPASTVPAWLVMATGKNPGKLGYFDFASKEPTSYKQVLVNSSLIDAMTLWDYVGEADGKVGVFNVPGTFPPHAVKGLLVTGLLTPSTDVTFTYPNWLGSQIKDLTGGEYIADIPRFGSNIETYFDTIKHVTDMHEKAANHIISSLAPEFFMGVWTATDKAGHFYWHISDPSHPGHDPDMARRLGDPLMDVYALVDEMIGRLMERFGEDTTFLFASDHGQRGFGGHVILNQWFRDQGWLAPRGEGRRQVRHWLKVDQIFDLLPDFVQKLASPFTRKAIGRTFATDLSNVWDMTQTKVYAINTGQIYINVKGRDPQGIVEPGHEYNELVVAIREGLTNLVDPRTGRTIKASVWTRDEIWYGENLHRAPDLLVEIEDPFYAHATNLNKEGKLFTYFNEDYDIFAGVHRRMGVLMAYGPGIQAGQRLNSAKITDIAPTALHLMGLEIPEDMDGQVLQELFSPDSEPAQREPAYRTGKSIHHEAQEAYDEAQKTTIEERLRDLGYLE